MKLYRFDQFIMMDLSDKESIIQNTSGITKINHPQVIEFLKIIDRENVLTVEHKYIEDFFKELTPRVIEFFEKSSIINEVKKKEEYSQILFFSNDKTINKSLNFNLEGSSIEFRIECIKSAESIDNKILEISNIEDFLIIVVLNPFDYNMFVKSNDLLRKRNLKVVYCIGYNSKFYITNIFKREWHNPCPKCFFSQLEASLRAKNRNSHSVTFQTIVDLIYSKNIKYTPELPVSNRNVIGLVQKLLSFDELDVERHANEIIEIDLKGETQYDQPIHWELCDCIY